MPSSELEAGIAAFELFRRAGLASSGGEARRLIRGGGGRVNDAAAETETAPVTLSDVNADGVIKLSAGKKRHVLVRPVVARRITPAPERLTALRPGERVAVSRGAEFAGAGR